jgi:RIO kinase 1
MRVPDSLQPLLALGVIDEVIRPIQSGKEAEVFLVASRGHLRVAKVYKDAAFRSFKNRADYTEGRKGRNTRRERAKGKGSRYGKAEIESAWRSAEVDTIYKLRDIGVRVPEAYDFVEGVLVMELVEGHNGEPAPRLADVNLEADHAWDIYNELLREVTKMLCAGLVHGDLSDFNVLLAADGPVIIDFPQAIDATANRNARRILIRDVDNLTSFLSRWVPDLRGKPYGQELWELYENGQLTPDTKLTGRVKKGRKKADVERIMDEISAAVKDENRRRFNLGLSTIGEVDPVAPTTKPMPRNPVSQDRKPKPKPKPKPNSSPKPSRSRNRNRNRNPDRGRDRNGDRDRSRANKRTGPPRKKAVSVKAAETMDLDALLSFDD